jgi:DNA topoisomerase-1
VTLDPLLSARAAGLRYTTDTRPGIRRVRHGSTFRYYTAEGRRVTNRAELERIKALVIPPAWEDVWICPDPRGHLQATGRDARRRKQYRYHPKWRVVRDETKYYRLIGFARTLPLIRRRTSADLRRRGLEREKVLALVVQLLEKTLIRVGNDEYARANRSFGLTTLRDAHVDVRGGRVRFTFRGKSGVEHEISLDDRRLARIVRACRDIPGYDLFQYYDEHGQPQTIGSADVNQYLKAICGEDYTSKDFRTWAGTVLAACLLRECEPCRSDAHGKRTIVKAVESVAEKLGNTKAVSRKCYIHPAVFDAYLDGSLMKTAAPLGEAAVLALLQRASRAARKKAS